VTRPARTQSGPRTRSNGLGRASQPQALKAFARQARKRMRIESGGIVGRKARSCTRSSPHSTQKRQVLACPVLYRNGAPGTIRTCDLCLRRAAVRYRCSRARRHSSPPDWPRRIPRGLLFYLETAAKLLSLLEGISPIFSKFPMKSLNNQTDFDSAIRRFDPSRPSHRYYQASSILLPSPSLASRA
jgi:hypothetical protein